MSQMDFETYVGETMNEQRHGFGKLYCNSFKSENGKIEVTTRTLLYQGQWEAGKRQGFGTSYHIIGLPVYRGEWKDDMFHGWGRKYEFDGSWTEGYWESGQPKHNTMKYVDGYAPFDLNHSWEDFTLTEPDTYACPDSGVYKGDWENGRPHGHGRYVCANHALYEGDWVDGLPNGKGTFYNPNSTIDYCGEVKNGMNHGYGISFFSDRSYYEGTWDNDCASGYGLFMKPYGEVITDPNDPSASMWIPASWYIGEIKDNQADGQGCIFILDPDPNDITDAQGSTGNWKAAQTNEKLHAILDYKGNRQYLWYEGQVKNGDPHGEGTFFDANGQRRFSGQVMGSIEPSGLTFGSVPKWTDDSSDKNAAPWVDRNWDRIMKLGYGKFYTGHGHLWYEGSMENKVL